VKGQTRLNPRLPGKLPLKWYVNVCDKIQYVWCDQNAEQLKLTERQKQLLKTSAWPK